MAQKPQVIDVTKSYIPGDPNSFPENLVSTNKEDGEETTVPVNFYEGYNFLPTSYGYRSFFGTSSRLDIPPVPSRVQFVLSYQSNEYINNLIALCEDGIWIIDPTTNTNIWKQVVTHTFDSEVFEEWTWCIIENSIYMYKQGGANVYNTTNVDDVVNGLSISIVTNTPTFLNMSGQMGIFKAGTRLGFWDSANSVAWSSNLDLNDFTPSLENLAGNTIFGYVIGRITHIRDHGEGFIVYSTKSIVGVAFSSESNLLWDAHNITNTAGVALGREVTQGINNSEHIVNSTAGLHRVGAYNGLTKVHEFSPIAVEISDVIRESREPVFLDVIEGRYLYLHIINNDYINGKISFETISIPSLELDGIPVLESSTIPPSLMVKMIQKIERDTTDSTYGDTLTKYTEDGIPFDIIEWEVSYRINSTLGLFEKYQSPSIASDFKYADSSTLDRRSIDWDNRTPTGNVFVPAGGDYNSLDMGVVLPTKEDFLDRSKQSKSNFSSAAAKVIRYQTDAFTSEDALGTYSPAYILKQSVDSIPSYLDIPTRTSLGLLEGMYNIHSIWKDFEKRQDLAIKNFTEIVAELVPFEWKAYSTSGVIESLIEAPSYQIFDMFKPYGNIGIQTTAGSKGFFYHKTYRDYYDCILAGVKNVTAINEYSLIDNGITDAPFTVNYFDALDIVPSSSGVITRIPLTGHSDNYLQEIIEDSLANGIYLNGFNRLMEFLPIGEFGVVAPWKMSGAITLGVRDFGGGLTTYYCECIPRQYLSIPNEWLDSNPIVEASISTVVAPGSGASGFPNPNNYPLTITAVTGGAWVDYASGYTLYSKIYIAIVKDSNGSVSDRKVIDVSPTTNKRLLLVNNGTENLPAGYSYRIYVASHSEVEFNIRYMDFSLDLTESLYINSAASLPNTIANLPDSNLYSTGNTYVDNSLGAFSYTTSGTVPVAIKYYLIPLEGSIAGTPVLILDSLTNSPVSLTFTLDISKPYTGYLFAFEYFEPSFSHLVTYVQNITLIPNPKSVTIYDYGSPYGTTGTSVAGLFKLPKTFAPYTEGTPGEVTINQTFEGVYFKVQEETLEIKSSYPYLINGWSSGGVAAFPSPTEYPLTAIALTGGSWESSTTVIGAYYALYDKSTGEVSDRKALGYLSLSAGKRIRVSITNAPPSGFGYRLYLAVAYKPHNIYYLNNDFDVSSYTYINNLASFTNYLSNFPDPLVVTSGNTYEVAVEPTDYNYSITNVGYPSWQNNTLVYLSFANGPTLSLGMLGMTTTDTLTINNTSGKLLYVYIQYEYAGTVYTQASGIAIGGSIYIDASAGGLASVTLIPNPNYIPLAFATSSPSIPGDIFGYHQSFAQTKVQLASFFRNSEMMSQWHTGSLGDKLFRGSTNPDKYFLENKGDYLEVWTDINNAFATDSYGVVLLLRQVHGFAYMYEVYEEPLGSIIPAISVDLGGASIDPTLDSEGVYNTIGAFFTPKNKVAATLNNGVLTKGASTVIDGYAGAEAEILDYLTPDDSMYSVNKYLVPPTYDEGESFYYIKDAETIYRSCTIFDHKVGIVSSLETPLWNTDLYLENFIPLDIPMEEYMVVSEGLGILPGAEFLIQEGTPAPSYPTFTGAFVYDLFLKKWGKMKEDYKVIFSYSPINSNLGGSISYTNFGMDAGVVLNSFELSVFDKEPVDSWIRLGKIGYYRLGNTTALEVKAMFRANSSGSIVVDTSLDGRTLFVPVRYTKTYKNVVSLTAHPSISGRWHTIKIEGNYDLQYLEFRGTISGRR